MMQTGGKRKRRVEIDESNDGTSSKSENSILDQSRDFFRQHFEARFNPLDDLHLPQVKHEEEKLHDATNVTESEWEGISDHEKIETYFIRSRRENQQEIQSSYDEYKSFMTSKPPSSSMNLSSERKKRLDKVNQEEIVADAENIKKDIALQRLLRESHLLDPQDSTSLPGYNKHKALDLRLQDIGSKTSNYIQRKMPLAQRRGIHLKAARKEATRRRQARENGIILEKATHRRKDKPPRRERSIGTPSIGKFKAGMLTLSKKDIAKIHGAKAT